VIAISHVPVILIPDPAPWLAYASGEAHAARDARIGLTRRRASSASSGSRRCARRGPVERHLGAVYYPDDAAERYGLHGARHGRPRSPRSRAEWAATSSVARRPRGGRGSVVARRGAASAASAITSSSSRARDVDVIVGRHEQKTGLGRLGSVVLR